MRNIFQIFICLLLLLLFGCETEDYVSVVGQIEGTVVDADTKEPIAKCEVISSSHGTKFTDENGRFNFTDVEPGIIELTYKATGYENITRQFDVSAGKSVSANVSLKPISVVNNLIPSKNVLDFGNRTAVLNLILKNPTSSSINYHITSDTKWINTDPTQGTVLANMESTIAISVDRNEISEGSYEKILYIETSAGSIEILIQVIKGSQVKPSVNTLSVTQIENTPLTIMAEGAVITVGSSSITRHGFCYSIGEDPTLENNIGFTNYGDITTPQNFSGKISNLEYDKEYHVRAYAVNETGTGYGEPITVILTNKEIPEISTKEASNITASSATLNGTLKGKIKEYGFYCGSSSNPTTKVCVKSYESPTAVGPGSYTATVSNLKENTTYYFQAYAIDESDNITRGTVQSFKTQMTPVPSATELSTKAATDITTSSATLNGTLKGKIKEYGFYCGTSSNPTTKVCVKSYESPTAVGPGSYTATVSNLKENTTYYFQAYAIAESDNITRGTVQSFKTQMTPVPSATELSTKAATDITTSSATLNGTLKGKIKEYGFYWGSSSNPTTKVCVKSFVSPTAVGPYSYTATVSNLKENTTYYFQAYAIDESNNITRGTVQSFKTQMTPVISTTDVLTKDIANITGTSATLNGLVSTNGKIREYGFYYGTSSNPTMRVCVKNFTSPSTIVSEEYSTKLNNLKENTKYYCQAYAIDDSNNIIRGNEKSFLTKTNPTITINSLRMDLVSSKYTNEYDMYGEATLYPQGNVVIEAGFLYRGDGYAITYSNATKIQCEIKDNKISFNERYSQTGTMGRYYRAYMILADGTIIYNGDSIYVSSGLPYQK